ARQEESLRGLHRCSQRRVTTSTAFASIPGGFAMRTAFGALGHAAVLAAGLLAAATPGLAARDPLPARAVRRRPAEDGGAHPKPSPTIGGLAFSPDGKTLACAGRSLRLFDVATGKEVRRLDRRVYWPAQITFAPDGDSLLFIERSRTITRWKWA